MNYQSPIDIIQTQMQSQIEGDIYKAVMKVGVNVDKDELLKALQYDRDQYQKGYTDRDSEIIRCNECKYLGNHNVCPFFSPRNDFFCGHGERKQSD